MILSEGWYQFLWLGMFVFAVVAVLTCYAKNYPAAYVATLAMIFLLAIAIAATGTTFKQKGEVVNVDAEAAVVECKGFPIAAKSTFEGLRPGDKATIERQDNGDWKVTAFVHTEQIE